jgi:plasmid replication initiation protein
LISSWKSKGGFTISIADFREMLMLGDKYPTYKDLKARVIKPAQDELFEKADCWFNCNTRDFEIRKGRTVTQLHFKVIVPDLKQLKEVKKQKIIEMLRIHFGFKEEHLLDAKAPTIQRKKHCSL